MAENNNLKNVTDADFKELVIDNDKLVLVDFWAVWCGPCKMIGPVIEELSQERDDVFFAKVDVDNSPTTASKYGIMSIPTLAVFKNGKIVDTIVGAVPKGNIVKALDKHL